MFADKIRKLYINELLNTREIGEKLGISQWSVISLMRRKGIQRRTTQQSNKILFEKTPLSYNKVKLLTQCGKNLKLAALMLYWAEGGKSDYLKLDKSQFSKTYVRKNFDAKKINKLKHGVIHIRYSDKRLFRQIMKDIDIIQRKLNRQGS